MCDFSELNQIICEMEGKLLRYAESFLKNSHSAQDAVQDTFLRYIRYKREKEHAPIKNKSAWFFKTTRNICLDVLKSARVKSEVSLDMTDSSFIAFEESPHDETEKNDNMKMARKLMKDCLAAREQEVLSLKFEHEKSYREIAEILNLTTSNVGFIIHQAMKKLQTEYRKMENPPEGAAKQ